MGSNLRNVEDFDHPPPPYSTSRSEDPFHSPFHPLFVVAVVVVVVVVFDTESGIQEHLARS